MSAIETERFGKFAKTGDNSQGFPAHPRCMTVVSQEFVTAAVELSEAVLLLNTYDNAEEISSMPREFWLRWVKAAQVIRDFGVAK